MKKLLRDLSNHINGQNKADNDIRQYAKQSARQCEACFRYFDGQKINAHGVKNCFGAATEDGSHHAGKRVGSICFKNIQHKTSSGRAGKHFDKNKTVEIGGKKSSARQLLY